MKNWCRERRVSAATRGIAPGRTPEPLGLYLWAADRCASGALACHAFGALAASVAPLVGSGGACSEMWESLRLFLRHSSGALKGYLKASCDAFLEHTAVQLASAQAEQAHDIAWRKVRSLTCRGGAKWKGARALPGRIGEDGVVATTAQEVSGVVLRHFAAIEAAEVCSVDALADKHGRTGPAIAPGTARDIDNVCDLVTLRRLFARSKRGKACGIDGVRDDFCAIAPAEMADVFHPLLTKCALRVQEPLAHKCGIAVDLWKGKGKQLYMKWYRSLLLNSVVQKHHYRFMRGRLMVLLGAVFLDSQCGGFRGKGTALASMGVRGFLAATRACRVSAMALFVDLKSGFYTVVRELVMRLQTAGDDVERVIESISAPAQLESALLRLMAEPSIVERHLGNGHLSALLSEAHTNTWFVVEGQADVARAVKGSRPGCCLADFVFNVAFAPALVDVRCALGDGNFLWAPPAAQHVFCVDDDADVVRGVDHVHPVNHSMPSDFTYADDSCFCCVLRSNIGVADTILRACTIVAEALMRRGMVVNWDRGKSAALVEVRGALSRSARRDLYLEHGSMIAIPGTESVVHLERSYVHLGADVRLGGSMGPAVSARVRAHAQAMLPLRRCVCPRRAVSPQAKLMFVDSLATSRLCHSIGAWDRLSKGQLARLQAALVGGYRSAMSMPHKDPTKDRSASDEVLAACGKLGMSTRLALARLRLLGPVLLHGPRAVLVLFDYLLMRGRGWPSLVVADLELVHLHWGVGSCGTGASALSDWIALVRASPDVWLRGLARVERRATAAHVDECLRRVWRRSLDSMLYQGCLDLPEGSAAVDVERGFLCYECGCALATAGAWRTHRARVHGARHPARALAFGTTCNACCMEFHSRPRLLWHLMHSVSACLDAYAAFCSPCDDATVDAAEVTDRLESRALRKAGDYDRVALIPAFRVQGCSLPPAVRGQFAPGVVLPPSVPDLHDSQAERMPAPSHMFLEATVYYVLHFFSGQRRPGDFQDWLDQSLAAVHYPVWVISLDVAIDAKLCDLSSSGGVARWLDLAIAGRVVMVLAGPPCETWSVARWNGGSRDTGNGPRAVRSSTQLWGLLDLDATERQQVALGNALMRTVILFLAAARVYGFSAVMEHPQLPGWMPDAPSSWNLPELKLLARAGGTECVHLDQCCCGTPWKKPTRLFAVNLPELGKLVAQLPGGGRCCPALGHRHVTLSGKGADGVYRTAPAKTYNSAMCKVLADAAFGGIARFLHGHVGCHGSGARSPL